jgi:hypothetical protein
MKRASLPVALLFAGGLVLLWAGERGFEAGTGRLVLSWAGVACCVAASLWRFSRVRGANAGSAQVEKALFGLQLVGLAALALYFAQSDALQKLDGTMLSAESPKLAGAIAGLWPALMAASVLPLATMELAYAAMAKSLTVEVGRVRDAMYSGLGAAGLLTFIFCAQYVAGERDVKVDLAYFRTTRPGEGTKRLVQSFDDTVTAALFFPPTNEVADQVTDYFDDLKKESPKLQVIRLDHAVEPAKAREYGVSGNGVIVLSKGARHESIFLGTELEKSKSQLRGLDQDVQKRLLQVSKSKKVVYLTTGHGERTEESLAIVDQRATIATLETKLRSQNYELKQLSGAEGLGQEVPKDAAAVMILGPSQPFQEPEARALAEYGAKGGKLFIALDPENGLEFKELLTPLGLSFKPVVLANDVAYARKTSTPSDRTIIGTKTYSSHPSVTSNGRNGTPFWLNQAGVLEELPAHPAELSIDFAIKGDPATWNDLNGNYQADVPPEVRKAWPLMAAVTKRKVGSTKVDDELRALVLGDSDAVADEIMNLSAGNGIAVLDGMKWLFGDEQLQGEINVETDVTLSRSRQQDVFWFYATTFLVPASVIGLGVVLRRKKKELKR